MAQDGVASVSYATYGLWEPSSPWRSEVRNTSTWGSYPPCCLRWFVPSRLTKPPPVGHWWRRCTLWTNTGKWTLCIARTVSLPSTTSHTYGITTLWTLEQQRTIEISLLGYFTRTCTDWHSSCISPFFSFSLLCKLRCDNFPLNKDDDNDDDEEMPLNGCSGSSSSSM